MSTTIRFDSEVPSCIALRSDKDGGYVNREPEVVKMLLGDVLGFLHDNRIEFIKVLRALIQDHTGLAPGLKDTKDVVDEIVKAIDGLTSEILVESRAADDVIGGFLALSARTQYAVATKLRHSPATAAFFKAS